MGLSYLQILRMKYKALFLDLDGTTVNHLADVASDRVQKAIYTIKDKIYVCVATGRPLSYAKPLLKHLNLSGLCIINNGTQIFDPQKNIVIKNIIINPDIIEPVTKILRKHRVEFYANTQDGQGLFEKRNTSQLLGIFVPELSMAKVDEIETELKAIHQIEIHKMVMPGKGIVSIEITNPEASKLHGIHEISKMLKISSEEIIGVGDGYNDFPLLLACGLKFAMGNAVDELKAIADFVAPSVENDGVAVIIEKFILPLLTGIN